MSHDFRATVRITALSALLAPMSPTFAQANLTDFEVSQNAALRYYQAWSLMSDELADSISEGLDEPHEPWEPPWSPAEEDLKLLRGAGNPIRILLRGSKLERCDFGIDYQRGPETLLPHLGELRRGAMLLIADARLKIDAGEIDEAVQRIAAGYRMAEHTAQNPLPITTIVAVSMFAVADGMATHADQRNLLNDEHRAALRTALERFDPDDPFSFVQAMEMERRMNVDWLRRRIQTHDSTESFETELQRLFGEQASRSGINLDFENLSAAHTQIELLDQMYAHARRAFSSANPAQELKRLEGNVDAGAYGPLASLFQPKFSLLYDQYYNRAKNLFEDAFSRVSG